MGARAIRILIAPDKFKTTLSSQQVIAALTEGLLSTFPTAQIKGQVVSDGGEGFLEALKTAQTVEQHTCEILDPLGRPAQGLLLYEPEKKCVFLESCQATGFHLIEAHQRNPFLTTSKGVADLLKAALQFQPQQIVIGLGSSATCDAGLGVAQAFGCQFLDRSGNSLTGEARNLSSIAKIVPPPQSALPENLTFYAIVDVLNPPIGLTGGVRVYSPQKGATPEQVEELERGVMNYIQCLEDLTETSLVNLAGGGAAGCLGLTLKALFGAELISGSKWMIKALKLEQAIQACDVLITGEGCFDEQSLAGKIPFSLLQLAQSYGKQTILVTGKHTSTNLFLAESLLFSIEDLITTGQIASIHDSYQGLHLLGQQLGKDSLLY